jgi:hypothetical protein
VEGDMTDETAPEPASGFDVLVRGGAAARRRALAAALGLEATAPDAEPASEQVTFDGGARPMPPTAPSLASVIRALVEVDHGEVERRARALDDLAEEGNR